MTTERLDEIEQSVIERLTTCDSPLYVIEEHRAAFNLARLGLESAERIETLTRENGELKQSQKDFQLAWAKQSESLIAERNKAVANARGERDCAWGLNNSLTVSRELLSGRIETLESERDTALKQVEELTKAKD